MSEEKKPPRKKTRVTLEKLTEIRRLYREGMPIVEIAEATGLHRHTVRTYIKEKFEDVVADEARKESLLEALKQHFKDIAEFARNDLRMQVNASVPQPEKKELPDTGSISTDGIMGLPGRGTPQYMAEEWLRMYRLSSLDSHLMKSLRVHTKESTFWTYYDKLRRIISAYENQSEKLWEWLQEEIINVPPEKYSPWDTASFKKMVFGNVLIATSCKEAEEPDLTMRDDTDSDGIMPVIKAKDSPVSLCAKQLLEQARQRPEWADLKAATEELISSDRQRELKRLAREIDEGLVGIELMHAFPGRCELCPV